MKGPRAFTTAGLLALVGAVSAAGVGGDRPSVPVDDLPEVLPAETPLGLPPDFEWTDGATPEQVALGRALFFDPILSVDGTVACASCHDPAHGFADAAPRSLGVEDRRTLRNAPTLYNRAFGQAFMWDGRASTLLEQVLLPIENELEMGSSVPAAIARLAETASYRERFDAAFGRSPDRDDLARALAAFVSRLLYGDTPVDRFHAGNSSALSAEARSGLWFFEGRGGCWKCHLGRNFSDEEFHNTGVGASDGVPEPGRFDVTGEDSDRGHFKTPTLRGLTETGPYMHDGSLATLEEVAEFYRGGGTRNSHLDPRIRPIEMSDREVESLVAFLRALSRGK